MEEYFDDIIEEAVSLEIETEHKAASDEMLHQISDPDVPNNYDFMLVIGLRIDNEEIPEETQSIYLKFCRTIKCIVDTIFSESEHGIYVLKRSSIADIDENDNTNDEIIQSSPLIFKTNTEPYAFDSIINTTLHGWSGAYYLTYYKFSILNNREPKLLMLNFFRLFYNIEAYLRQRIDKLTFEKSRRAPGVDMKTFILKNKDNTSSGLSRHVPELLQRLYSISLTTHHSTRRTMKTKSSSTTKISLNPTHRLNVSENLHKSSRTLC